MIIGRRSPTLSIDAHTSSPGVAYTNDILPVVSFGLEDHRLENHGSEAKSSEAENSEAESSETESLEVKIK